MKLFLQLLLLTLLACSHEGGEGARSGDVSDHFYERYRDCHLDPVVCLISSDSGTLAELYGKIDKHL